MNINMSKICIRKFTILEKIIFFYHTVKPGIYVLFIILNINCLQAVESINNISLINNDNAKIKSTETNVVKDLNTVITNNKANNNIKIEKTSKDLSPYNRDFKEVSNTVTNYYKNAFYNGNNLLQQIYSYFKTSPQSTLTKKEILNRVPEIEERLNMVRKINDINKDIDNLIVENNAIINIATAKELNNLNNFGKTMNINRTDNEKYMQKQKDEFKQKLKQLEKNGHLEDFKTSSLQQDIGKLKAQLMILDHDLMLDRLYSLWLQHGVETTFNNKTLNDLNKIGFPGEFNGDKEEYDKIFAKKITEMDNSVNSIENAIVVGKTQEKILSKLIEEKNALLAKNEDIINKWGGKDTFEPSVFNMIKTTVENIDSLKQADNNAQNYVSNIQANIDKSISNIEQKKYELDDNKNTLIMQLEQLHIKSSELNDKKQLLIDTVKGLSNMKSDIKTEIKQARYNKKNISDILSKCSTLDCKTALLHSSNKINHYKKVIPLNNKAEKYLLTAQKEYDVLQSKESLYNKSIENIIKIDENYNKFFKDIQKENILIKSLIKEANDILKLYNSQKNITEQEVDLLNYKIEMAEYKNEKAKLEQRVKQEELELIKMQTIDSRMDNEKKLKKEINGINSLLINNDTEIEEMKKQKEILTTKLTSVNKDVENLTQALQTLNNKKNVAINNEELLAELDNEIQEIVEIQQPSLFMSPKILVRLFDKEQLSASQQAQLKTISYINNNIDKVRYTNNKRLNANIQNTFKDNIINDGKNIGNINDSMWYSINMDMSNDRDDLTKSSNGSTLINFGYNFNYIDNIDSSVAISFNQTKSDLKMYSKDIPVNTYDFALSLFNKYDFGNDIVLSGMLSYNHNIVKDRKTKNIKYDYVDENADYIISSFTKSTHKKHYNDIALSLSAVHNYNILDNVKLTSGITADYFTTYKVNNALILSPMFEVGSVNGFYHNMLFPVVYVKYNANTNNKNIRVSDNRKVNLDKNNMEYGIKTKVGLTDKANVSFIYSGDSNRNNNIGANVGIEF